MKSIIFLILIFLIISFDICENVSTPKIKRLTTKRTTTKRTTTKTKLYLGSSDSESGYESDKRGDGSYGQKYKEKNVLKTIHKTEINGKTHEKEHPVGFKVLTKNLNDDLGVSRDTSVGRQIEKSAPAYFEIKELHRNHIGTGSSRQAQEYRNWQDEAIKEGKLGNAIQLNQIEYAHDSNFQKIAKSPSGQAATDSYNNMIVKNPELMRGHGDANFDLLKLSRGEQIESILARNLAIEQRNTYTQNDIDFAKKLLKLDDKKQANNFDKLQH
jgi:hypothetical protein